MRFFEVRALTRRYGLDPKNPQTRAAVRAYLDGQKLTVSHLKHLALGSGSTVTVFDPGSGTPLPQPVPHVSLNFAATKPLLVPVQDAAVYLETNFMENVGRGSGPHAEIMTHAMEQARRAVGEFVDYDPDHHVVIFTANTSEGMNLMANLAARKPGNFFIVSPASHHSAQLPARARKLFWYFELNPNGTYDLNSIERKLSVLSRSFTPTIIIESQSNVTGYKMPVEEVCQLAAKYSATVFIDHAQGASSIPLSLKKLRGNVFIVFSGHKLYARDGSGAIIGPREMLKGDPVLPAGGTISAVTQSDAFFADPPYNLESGTPAFVAQASLGKAAATLSEAGLENIAAEEMRLTRIIWGGISKLAGIRILGETDLDAVERGPVLSFAMQAEDGSYIPPGFFGKALEVFYGVDMRVGQFCAHPYLYFLHGASPEQALAHARLHADRHRAGCAALPGDERYHASRLSWGFPTPDAHLSDLPMMLDEIRKMWPNKCALRLDPVAGEFYFPGQPRVLTQGRFDLRQKGPYRLT